MCSSDLGQCAPCHGPTGDGGRGANLARPKLPRATDDPALFRILSGGIEGTEMPGTWAMSEHELWQTAAFVRTLGRTAVEEQLSGNAARGRELFDGKGKCGGCHMVEGEGGRLGPVLTEVGARRTAKYLRAKLTDPSSALPESFMQVEALTQTGRRISGIRLNEDTFSLQVMDLSGEPHSFWKSDLTELRKDRTRSPMPSYRAAFSTGELEDVVAYLVSLRGEAK